MSPQAAHVAAPARLAAAWNQFWHAPVSVAALGLFRVLFAYCLWREVTTTRGRSVFGVSDGSFHLPYTSLVPTMSEAVFEIVHAVQYPLIALLGVGLLWRTSTALLLVLQGWVFFSDQLNFRNHPYFFLLVLVVLLASPAADAFSVPALLRGRKAGLGYTDALLGGTAPRTGQRLLQAQVSLVYVLAALQKVHERYLTGEVLEDKLRPALLTEDFGVWLASQVGRERYVAFARAPEPYAIMAAAVVIVELALPFGLWFKRTRRLAVLTGIGLHVTILLTMDINTFSFAMMASYLLFLEPETVPQATRRVGQILSRVIAPARRLA